MKASVNSLCPCGSRQKYKKCCQKFHKGTLPNTALELMKSRYVAYAFSLPKYIISTTHPENKEYQEEKEQWQKSILQFCKDCDFNGLEILEFINGINEAFVTFNVQLTCNGEDNSFTEKSKFIKVNSRWLYHSGEFKS